MKYVIVVVLALGLFAGYWAVFLQKEVPGNRYENRTLGIAFSYPEGFQLSEVETGSDADRAHTITLVQASDVALPEAGEGPTSVTIVVHEPSNTTLDAWMREAPASNFHLGTGVVASTTIDGKEAVIFPWSGLYEGETTAFSYNDRIIAISGTVLSQDDGMRAAYELVQDTFELK